MDGKELFKFLDLVDDLRSRRETCEEGWKEATEPKNISKLQGKAEVYKETEERLKKLLREVNS
jgi:predicted  nucleic acid-binding Zn-ribbon protein